MGLRGTHQKESTQPRCAPSAKALLVDEDAGDLQYYFNILEGYVSSGCATLIRRVSACLADEAFEFVMVSQGTPNFEGSCVLKRATQVNRRLPVLVVPRCLDMGCYLEAMQLGAVDYLVEPLTVSG